MTSKGNQKEMKKQQKAHTNSQVSALPPIETLADTN